MEHKMQIHTLSDSKHKLYEDLAKCMEYTPANPMQVYHILHSISLAEKLEEDMLAKMPEEVMEAEVTVTDSWGDSNPQARQLFENLATHYMGFWNNVAEYQKEPSEMTKTKMLQHFEHQLKAHDMLAMFVQSNCPVLCPEIKAILANWMATKKM